jgi:hypothetical protein
MKLPLRPSQVKRSNLLVQRVSEEEIELISNNPTRHSEAHIIDLWRKYISQRGTAEGASGQFRSMEKMICSYLECGVFNSNRYFTEVCLKYVSSM